MIRVFYIIPKMGNDLTFEFFICLSKTVSFSKILGLSSFYFNIL